MSLRLCSRAPRMMSWSATGWSPGWSSGDLDVRTHVRPPRAASASLPRPADSSHAATRRRRRSSARRVDGVLSKWHDGLVIDVTETRPGLLARAPTQRLIRTVDGSPTATTGRARRCSPAGRRAHVVAHLALNAEGLARRAARRASTGRRPQPDVRLATRRATATSTTWPRPTRPSCATGCSAATTALDERDRGGARRPRGRAAIERTPGGRRFAPRDVVPGMRLREVEIHHVDLGAGYTAADWSDGLRRSCCSTR